MSNEDLVCSITLEPIKSIKTVVGTSVGHIYDKDAISNWLQHNELDPNTMLPVPTKQLIKIEYPEIEYLDIEDIRLGIKQYTDTWSISMDSKTVDIIYKFSKNNLSPRDILSSSNRFINSDINIEKYKIYDLELNSDGIFRYQQDKYVLFQNTNLVFIQQINKNYNNHVFSRCKFTNSIFYKCCFKNTLFLDCDLKYVNFIECSFTGNITCFNGSDSNSITRFIGCTVEPFFPSNINETYVNGNTSDPWKICDILKCRKLIPDSNSLNEYHVISNNGNIDLTSTTVIGNLCNFNQKELYTYWFYNACKKNKIEYVNYILTSKKDFLLTSINFYDLLLFSLLNFNEDLFELLVHHVPIYQFSKMKNLFDESIKTPRKNKIINILYNIDNTLMDNVSLNLFLFSDDLLSKDNRDILVKYICKNDTLNLGDIFIYSLTYHHYNLIGNLIENYVNIDIFLPSIKEKILSLQDKKYDFTHFIEKGLSQIVSSWKDTHNLNLYVRIDILFNFLNIELYKK